MSTRTLEDYRAHAEFHARANPSGVGAAVVSTTFEADRRIWDCIVTDEREWHYIRVLGDDVGPFPNLSTEDIELGIERLAATLPAPHRIRQMLNLNPLHIGRDGEAHD